MWGQHTPPAEVSLLDDRAGLARADVLCSHCWTPLLNTGLGGVVGIYEELLCCRTRDGRCGIPA